MAILTARISRVTLSPTRQFKNSNLPNRAMTGLKGMARAIRGSNQAIAQNEDPKLSKALPYLHLAIAIGTASYPEYSCLLHC